ncbi:hypothetical protein DOY81_006278 [Sarcophaga bullata]|nr:hypothetical protein DOY81_006278 [Sarcophaga bullata]
MTTSYEDEREFLTLTRTSGVPFEVNSQWKLTIKYSGELRKDNGGFYMSTYKDTEGKAHYLATTQFESTDARHAFPCYDEPAKRAKSPSPLIMMPSIVLFQICLAFIVSDFSYSEAILNGLKHRLYSRPNAKDEREFALVSGMLITERLREYYDVPFMLPKMDQVAVPDFSAGGMENWVWLPIVRGLCCTTRKPQLCSLRASIASISAHEICHQYFGDLVAIEWWTYLWLKERLCQFVLLQDIGSSAAVLDMWSNALTDEVFRRGLHNYLTVKAAKEEKLFEAIQTAAKELNHVIPATVEEMMSTWTRQGGFPLLTVTRNYNDGSFTIKQAGYHEDKSIVDTKIWYVPINFAVASNSDYRNTVASHYLKKVAELKVDDVKVSKDDWLLLNKQSTGYYRIIYDEENYKLLIKGLQTRPHKMHPRNRAQLMNDAYYFTASGRLNHSILLDMMVYLKQEDQYAPWATAEKIINTYNRYLSGDSDYKHFQEYVAELVANIYEKLGVNDEPGEQHYQKYTRNSVVNIACLAGVPSCLEEANNKLKGWVENGDPIEPNLRSHIYCNGLRQTGDKEFDFVYKTLMESTDQAYRTSLISALGCSQQEAQLKRFIASSIDETNQLRDQERYTLLRPVYSRGEVGFMACIDFLKEFWPVYATLKSGFSGSNPLDDDISGMADYVVNKKQEEELLALVAMVKGSEHVTTTLETSVQNSIKNNFDWLERNRSPLMTWINNYHNSSNGNGTSNGNGNGNGNGNNDNGNGGDGAASVTISTVVIVSSLYMSLARLF